MGIRWDQSFTQKRSGDWEMRVYFFCGGGGNDWSSPVRVSHLGGGEEEELEDKDDHHKGKERDKKRHIMEERERGGTGPGRRTTLVVAFLELNSLHVRTLSLVQQTVLCAE